MKLRANRKNLKTHVQSMMGALGSWSPENEAALIKLALQEAGQYEFKKQYEHLAALDTLLGTYGVEGFCLDEDGGESCSLRPFLSVSYCNTGDTYGTTLMYVDGTLYIGDWGSIVESMPQPAE